MAATSKDIYIYNLPHDDTTALCEILDQENKWEELCSLMKYEASTIQQIRRHESSGQSPTEMLLRMWGHQNHNVLELFILLRRMKVFNGMEVIKDSVDPMYHKWIEEQQLSEPKCFVATPTLDEGEESKILNVSHIVLSEKPIAAQENINVNGNDNCEPEIIVKDDPDVQSNENNESLIIKCEEPWPKSPTTPKERVTGLRLSAVTDIQCVTGSAGALPHIAYEELQLATDNWNQANLLGQGGFGTVFKGTWKCTKVAIKRIEQRVDKPEASNEQLRQSITELHCLNAYRHDNVLPLYGYSIGGPQPCLVYQYMSGGCLDRRLRTKDSSKILSWSKRLSIAIGTARGLQFLHTIGNIPLIHGDIKPANILLDDNDTPRIGDFGLAREGPHSEYTHITVSRIFGTKPYLPEEFLRASKFSTKVDTFSFGIVLFEIGTSLTAYSNQRDKDNKYLKDYIVNYTGDLIEIKDPRLEGGDNIYKQLMHIGKLCVNRKAKDRPEMVSVLIQLEGIDSS